MARRSPARRLTERDREVLRWVGQGGVATLDQVARRLWPGKKVETALDRLRQLARAGYLSVHMWDCGTELSESGRQLYALTEEGSLLFSPAERQLLCTGLPSPAEVRQQVLAQEAYLKLEEFAREQGARLVGWKAERVLRRELLQRHAGAKRRGHPPFEGDIPDAEVTVLTGSGERQILYLEVDGEYYGKMLWQKAASAGKAGYPIIWICTEARAGHVQRAVAGYPNIRVLAIQEPGRAWRGSGKSEE